MVRADSRVHVDITGDAKGLGKAIDGAEKDVKGFGSQAKLLGGALAAGFATDAVLDFTKTALAEGDRLGDATHRLESQLGGLSAPLIAAAEDFAHLGQSTQDMLELEAKIVDVGTALGIADEQLAPLAQDAAETAAALVLITDMSAEEAIDQIGKAADGSEKAMKALGINVSEAEKVTRALKDTGKELPAQLTEQDIAAAGLALTLEELNPRIQTAISGTGDWEQKSAEMEARMETLTGKIGAALDGPLTGLLGWILEGISGWENLATAMEAPDFDALGTAAQLATTPFRIWAGVLENIAGLLNDLGQGTHFDTGDLARARSGSGAGSGGGGHPTTNIIVQPRDNWETESAVVNALRDHMNRAGPIL